MTIQRDERGRLNIHSGLQAESLMDKGLLQDTQGENIFRPMADIEVIKLGGQSIIDRR